MNHEAFSIRNTLLDSLVFERDYTSMMMDTPDTIALETSIDQYIYYIPDPLFPKNQDLIISFLRGYQNMRIENITPDMMKIDGSTLGKREFRKLIGFLGSYTCILPDELSGFIEFSRLSSVQDGQFEMPTSFETSEYISLIDPRWHSLRLGLLEMTYIASVLEESQRSLGQ